MSTTKRSGLAPVLTLATLVAATLFPAPAEAATAAEAFERFKALEGDWVAAEDGPMTKKGELVSSFRVTAAGSAVVETEFPGTDHEMVTIYYREGDTLVLDHYCMEGNQPRMRAREFAGAKVHFTFDGGGNIADPKKDRHMHSAWIELVGPHEIRSEWTEIAEGEPVLVVPVHLVRAGS